MDFTGVSGTGHGHRRLGRPLLWGADQFLRMLDETCGYGLSPTTSYPQTQGTWKAPHHSCGLIAAPVQLGFDLRQNTQPPWALVSLPAE